MNSSLLIRLVAFALINALLITGGYFLTKNRSQYISWLSLVFSIALVYWLFINQHPVLKMLAIIATTFTAMKIVAVSSMPDKTTLKLSFGKWFAFAGGWAGMRPQPFETLGEPSQPGATRMISFGISRLVLGLLLIYVTRLLIHHNIIPGGSLGYIITALLLLICFSLILHFGLLSISAGMWRLQGAATYYLFRRPAAALSITEFWGKRWNLAFSEMTSIAIFRPLKQRFGNAAAVFVSFVFSGLLHELALSVPVNAGYGLPTFYFLIHAFIVALERTIQKRYPLFLANKTTAHIWVFFWLILPAQLLFHPQFINGVVLPLAGLSPISLPQ